LVAGTGEPLLWLHGASGGGWNPFLERLTSTYTVLAPDHPGFGKSELTNWFDSIDDMAFHYRDLLDILGYDQVFVCGNSIGAWIGLQFALTHSHLVRKLAVINPAGIHIPGKDAFDPFLLTFPQLLERCFYDKSKVPDIPNDDDTQMQLLKNRAMYARLTWEKGYDPKLLHRLQGLKVSTLIIAGKHDEVVPVEYSQKLEKKIPGATLHVIDECGHLPHVEKPEILHNLLTQFFK
jgi:pimeloyl-ACP methyl ester carboxylesterase